MSDDKVIHIADWRKRTSEPIVIGPTWMFDMRVFVGMDGYTGTILNQGDFFGHLSEADHLRKYADALDQLSWFLRQQAEDLEPCDDGAPLATAVVFQSSRVRVRINDDKVTTDEQYAWLDSRFDDAKEAARPKEPAQ